ncbi:MAG: hypothetical protein JO297_09140 [Nitrososphaeraceae archaeon]|nr:hypothetical protein [Nitrososphaeraceae archaeon]
MRHPSNSEFLRFAKHLEEITEQDIKAALEREDNSSEEFLIFAKMLCAKRGMTHTEWEVLFREQTKPYLTILTYRS